MTEQRDDGGPAYPSWRPAYEGNSSVTPDGEYLPGMSLRDYFAGRALAGICARELAPSVTVEMISEDCYKLADAMLAERKK